MHYEAVSAVCLPLVLDCTFFNSLVLLLIFDFFSSLQDLTRLYEKLSRRLCFFLETQKYNFKLGVWSSKYVIDTVIPTFHSIVERCCLL